MLAVGPLAHRGDEVVVFWGVVVMVKVSREVPLAVVTVGKQSKSLSPSPSLSCCSGPRNVGQPSKLVAQQPRAAASSRTVAG
jgi:hypothetical protein